MVSHEPAKPVLATSRSATLASDLDAKAKEFTNTPPSQSEHLTAFEAVNKLIVAAHQEFETKWTPDAQVNEPAEYEAESEHIKSLATESTNHLSALSEHVTAYQKAHGADDSIRETAERVQASLSDLAPANVNSTADDEDEDAENRTGTGYGPGHADSGSIKEAAKRALQELKKLILAFIQMIQRLLFGAKPA